MTAFSQYSGEFGPGTLDLPTFLEFAVANNLHFYAISWHEINAVPGPTDWQVSTENLPAHVAIGRAMIAARLSLGHPAIFIDEYSSPTSAALPGWDAGWIAAAERAKVDEASRSCWMLPDGTASTCAPPMLDGMFNPDGTPTADYWVNRFYASMTGSVVSTSTSDSGVTSFGAVDATGVLRLVIGRHQSCTTTVNPACNQPAGVTPAPVDVSIDLNVGTLSSRYHVVVSRIPNQRGTIPAPTVVSSADTASSGGHVALDLGSVADGEAYTVTVSPAP